MTTKQIIDLFQAHDTLKIIDTRKLIEYIDMCLLKDTESHIPGETDHHHIIPKANDCFPEYINLTENPWNGVFLKHTDHFEAHKLISEALDVYSQVSAFYKMYNIHNIKKITPHLKSTAN